jgi:hypothetical protein
MFRICFSQLKPTGSSLAASAENGGHSKFQKFRNPKVYKFQKFKNCKKRVLNNLD